MLLSVVCLSLCLVLHAHAHIDIDTRNHCSGAEFHQPPNITEIALDEIESPSWLFSLPELGDFAQQAEYFVRRVRLSRAQARRHSELLAGVRYQLNKIWQDFEVTQFGSTFTGLAFATSDIDVHITIKETNNTNNKPADYVLQAAEVFRKNNSYTGVITKTNVSKPIVKFVHTQTNQRFDVGITTPGIDGNPAIMKYLFQIDRRAIPLMIIIKYWIQLNNLHVSFHMPSIFWNAFVVLYLQQVNILPPVHILQKYAEPKIVNDWNVAFEEPYEYLYSSENNSTLYELLRGFYEYYNVFDFEKYCISIFAGTPVPRQLFESVETVPDVFHLYKYKVKSNVSTPLDNDTPLCVQNTFAHNKQFGHGTPELLATVKDCFQQAVDIFKTHRQKDLLSALLTN